MAADTPAWAGRRRVLLRGGNVYSPADPFATAMLLDGPVVAWIGSDGAALALADGVDELVELDGALVTPGFVDAHVGVTGAAAGDGAPGAAQVRREAAARGVVALQVMAGPATDPRVLLDQAEAVPGPLLTVYRHHNGEPGTLLPAAGVRGIVSDAAVTASGDRPEAAVASVLVAATAAGVPTSIQITDARTSRVALAGLRAAAAEVGAQALGAIGHRLENPVGLQGEDLALAASLGIVVVLLPQGPHPLADAPLAAMAAAGVPMAFGSGAPAAPIDPWATVRAAVNHPDHLQRISARAAFAAHTRGGWRAGGDVGNGTLVPGAPAHYAVWDAVDLVVQAPDDRIQAWSTDPRSGTPGLPDMSWQAALPSCLRTVVAGHVVHARDGAGPA